MRKKRFVQLCAIAVIAALTVCGCRSTQTANSSKEVNSSSVSDKKEDSYLHLTYKGKNYTYNSRIITVMYAGVDSDKELTTYNRYTIAPRADVIELGIFDAYNKKISVLAISRDTITSVARYTMNGNYRDHYDTHLGYAYTYGDGGKVSCDNLKESVSKLLKGVPIHEYVVTNNSSVSKLNAIAGGLNVTVPNDDLVKRYPELKKGANVKLNAETSDAFARWRDTKIPYTNNGRMERQKEFSSKFLEKFVAMINADVEGTWNKINDYSQNYQTSIAKSQYLDLAKRLKTETFSEDQYYILKGKDKHDDEQDVDMFYADKEDLMDKIINLFYVEEK